MASQNEKLLHRQGQKVSRPQGEEELDPRVVKAGFDLTGYHIQSGRRSFADYAQTMIEEYGHGVRPYLKSWYLAIRYYPGINPTGMDSATLVDAEDSYN